MTTQEQLKEIQEQMEWMQLDIRQIHTMMLQERAARNRAEFERLDRLLAELFALREPRPGEIRVVPGRKPL